MAYSSLANWDGRASSSRHSSPSPHTSADDSNPSLAAQAAQSGPSTSAVSAERVSKLRPGEDRTSSFDMPPSPTTNEERAVPVSGSPERAVDKMLFLPESASEPEPVQAGIALPAQEVDTRVAGSEVTDHLVQTAVKSRPSTPPTAQSSTPLLDMQVPSEPSSKGSTAVDPEPLQSTLEVPLSAIPSDVNSNTTALSNSKTNSASSTAPPAGSLVVSTDAPSGSSKYIDATRTESSPGIHDSTPAQDADVEMADITTDAPDRQSQDMPSDSGSSRSRRRAVPRIAAAAVLNALASPQAGPSSDQLGVRSSGPPPRLGNLGPSESFTSFTSFTRLASRGSSTSSHGIKRTFFESPSPGSTSRDSTAPPPRKQQKQRHAYEAEAGPSTLYRSISPPPFQTRSTHRSLHGGTKNRQLCYVNVPPFPQGVSREEYFPMELYVPIEVNGGKTPKRKAKERAEQTIKVVASLDLAAELQLQAGPPPPDSSKRKRPMKKDTSVARNSSEVRTAQPPPQPRKRADPKGKEKAVSRMSELRATTQLPEPPNSVRYPSLPATPPPPDPYHDKYANFAPPNANTAIVPADGFAPLEIAGVEVDYPDELPLTSLLLCASLRHIAPGRSADWWRRRAREEEEVMKLWREQVEREKQKLMTPFGPGPQIGWASSSASASASTSKKVKAEPSTSKANMNASASSARRKREAKGKAALRKQAGASASGGVPPPQPSLPPPSLPPHDGISSPAPAPASARSSRIRRPSARARASAVDATE
ncbi:uncharacterized protein C8Q71DRAFT_452643 [Rhodofomes roseus]|uniref:Uncharacterized protein n=1 Tax=Rhodofomes roseus TaxID=34475 RepID=A0ABQ8JZ36_9APHY|nr:uncharacterized protein C8Q71DRAFT_452643 [Rhodofomes roseus]KAH9828971.1 hypothetical protein C8Q71DRAFT_452643 [Rhodofomes roseus]